MTIRKHKRLNISLTLTLLLLSILLIIISTITDYSFLTILAGTLLFWSLILLYVYPTKLVDIKILKVIVEENLQNIERIRMEYGLKNKGLYLPPKNLQGTETSVLLIPERQDSLFNTLINDSKKLRISSGIILDPPGGLLSKNIEKELNISFLKTDIKDIQQILFNYFVDMIDFAKNIEINLNENFIEVKIEKCIISEFGYPFNNNASLFFLSSTIACIIAKVSGKAVIIQSEVYESKTRTIKIYYELREV